MDIPQYPLQNSKGNTFGTVSLIPDDIEYGYSNNPFQFPTLKDLQLAYGYDVPGTQLVPDPKANNYTINNQPSGQCIRREPKHDSDTRSSTKTASCGNAEMRWDSSHDKRLTKRLSSCGSQQQQSPKGVYPGYKRCISKSACENGWYSGRMIARCKLDSPPAAISLALDSPTIPTGLKLGSFSVFNASSGTALADVTPEDDSIHVYYGGSNDSILGKVDDSNSGWYDSAFSQSGMTGSQVAAIIWVLTAGWIYVCLSSSHNL
ncbi:hypothetical protein KXV74_005720 [Aspergillus fumigatus]|nr:hypothetical protein KXW04_003571 [Aspergillus fumigatus]KAH2136728.1 hypothetical protein KXW66_002800 [Aspergillus fumigatus]KAH2176544.1 hypothetical protein KXV74_005720 [Aspergillus fumigatus]KAH2391737.1 hypothetical protein KXW92_009262 [Aspergillus fumigatus]